MEKNWLSRQYPHVCSPPQSLKKLRGRAARVGLLALIVVAPLYGPASMRGRAAGSPQISPSSSLTLRSQFLSSDSTAQTIAAGTNTYDISNTNYVFGQQQPANTLLFGYRIEMAIRQLGYALPYARAAGVSPARLLLNKFQRLNGLPVSDIVDQTVIMALDNQLVTSEQIDAARGPAFPLYSRMADPPANEPSRLHAARLRDIVFSGLPASISPISMLNQEEYIYFQQNFMMSSPTNPDASQVCDEFYYSELGDHCGFLGNQIRVFNDDFIASDTALHEYAHFLDANLYQTMPGTAMGTINTTNFYSISYDISQPVVSGWTFYPYRRGLPQRGDEFVGHYAGGWQDGTLQVFTAYEDFAESVALYVTGGRIFRQRASANTYLQEKYDFIKQNVFSGLEYDTGDLANLALLESNPITGDAFLVNNVIDYCWINPDYVFGLSYPAIDPSSGCGVTLSANDRAFPRSGGPGSFNVSPSRPCNWTVASNQSWITVTSPGSGLGAGEVTYSVMASTGRTRRNGTLTVAGQAFTVSQVGTNAISKPGLYSPGSGTFFLRNSISTGVGDSTFQYGPIAQTWIPLSGDWDGDGIVTPGLYDPATGTFYLKNSNSPGPADLTFTYGPPGAGWAPLVGDWNGDGVDTVGLYVPSTGAFFLKNSNTPGPADLVFNYGPGGLGWIPIAGDWDGDGTVTIGLFDPADAVFFLRNSNSSGAADVLFSYGPPGAGWVPVSGDWNAGGITNIGLYNPSTGVFFLRYSNAAGPADVTFNYGPAGAGWRPLVGNWNGL